MAVCIEFSRKNISCLVQSQVCTTQNRTFEECAEYYTFSAWNVRDTGFTTTHYWTKKNFTKVFLINVLTNSHCQLWMTCPKGHQRRWSKTTRLFKEKVCDLVQPQLDPKALFSNFRMLTVLLHFGHFFVSILIWSSNCLSYHITYSLFCRKLVLFYMGTLQFCKIHLYR